MTKPGQSVKLRAPKGAAVPSQGPPTFATRAPSQSWERLAPSDSPQNAVWIWYKPATVPYGLILRIADETYRDHPQLAAQWTMRRLLQVAGIEPATVLTWHIYGVPYPALNGTSPYLDAAIPPPAPGVDPSITVVCINGAPAAPPKAAPNSPAVIEIFEHIDSDWNASREIERDLGRLRKQLLDLMGRLKTLNRDLTPQERVHSNSQDKKDWVEARRGLRDGVTRLWKCIKAYDIGDTSSAGQRNYFDQIYNSYVIPRKNFENLLKAAKSFESYRKAIQTLQTEMNNAYSVASLDGERRAQQVISRIMQKVREASNKKNFLGVMLDS